MGERTGIAWTDSTWNPWRGCRKVSPGCAHCYMYREQARYGRDPKEVVRAAPATFNAPLRWKGPRRVFTCSWSDFFIEDADAWRPEAWEIIRKTPTLTYQILTKRPENIPSRLPLDWGLGYPNVWLGVSGENAMLANERGYHLTAVPAARRFLSAEPWLGRGNALVVTEFFDWAIIGGESGPGARPLDERSASFLKDQFVNAGKPVFVKQLGGWPDPRSHEKAVLDGRTWTEVPA